MKLHMFIPSCISLIMILKHHTKKVSHKCPQNWWTLESDDEKVDYICSIGHIVEPFNWYNQNATLKNHLKYTHTQSFNMQW